MNYSWIITLPKEIIFFENITSQRGINFWNSFHLPTKEVELGKMQNTEALH